MPSLLGGCKDRHPFVEVVDIRLEDIWLDEIAIAVNNVGEEKQHEIVKMAVSSF